MPHAVEMCKRRATGARDWLPGGNNRYRRPVENLCQDRPNWYFNEDAGMVRRLEFKNH